MKGLNPQQQAAVKQVEHPLLVLAGAGSGKTRVITEKIAYLVKQGLPARNIAALTFTNKAAREMQSRVAKLLHGSQSHGLRVSTFHSLGLDILRKEHKALGYKAAITLFDEYDKQTVIKSLFSQHVGDYDKKTVEQYAAIVGKWKNAFITSEQAIQFAHSQLDKHIAQIYEEYTRCLHAYNAVDFDDLILMPVLLFEKHHEVLQKWQNRIRYLLVDEYQDTNLTQYQLVKLLVGTLAKFTVVGDDDQSIYAWRGAQPENLAQLQRDFPRLEVIKLEQNYRSTGRILKVANHLIANNPHTFEKKLWSDLGHGEPLRILTNPNQDAEAEKIVSEILHHKLMNGTRYKDYAILYRGNHQSRLIEQSLRSFMVPYFISGGTSFFSYAEVKDVLSYLRLLSNPDDDAAFLRIVNTPRREIGATTLEKLGAYARERHVSLFAACGEIGLNSHLTDAPRKRLQNFHDWILQQATLIGAATDKIKLVNELLEKIGYSQYLREDSATRDAAERRIKNVSELLDWLQRIIDKNTADGEAFTLTDLVAKVLLLDVLERNREDEVNDEVSLMTLHAAKGLEFPHVFLIGVEEKILPHQNSIDEGNIEEERRLAYVGITRAKQTCTLSYCTHRKQRGVNEECAYSRFLDELPEEDLHWTAKKPLSEEAKENNKKSFFAGAKNLLSED
ncbi:MAG: DNA helicase Rep [Methylococcales bacterium]|nr:DNA helicase Rep [Methylococcales bacterium]